MVNVFIFNLKVRKRVMTCRSLLIYYKGKRKKSNYFHIQMVATSSTIKPDYKEKIIFEMKLYASDDNMIGHVRVCHGF